MPPKSQIPKPKLVKQHKRSKKVIAASCSQNLDAQEEDPLRSVSTPNVEVVVGNKGAPQDLSLLVTYDSHIASRIWTGEKPSKQLHVKNHSKTHNEWNLESSCQKIKDVVENIGLTQLVQNVHVKVDDALCSAFLERFYPETNTFHFSFGEMTITADDISNILGLRMEGLPVKGTGPHATTYEECVELVTNRCIKRRC